MIRLATFADIEKVNAIYEAHFDKEEQNSSFSNWQRGVYPTRATAENAVMNESLYVLEQDGEICASIILNHVQPCEYEKINWAIACPDSQAMTLHTLCVHPDMSGKGYGRKLVEFGLELAKKTGCKVLRLDTYEGNIPAQALYKKLGFTFAGSREVFFEGSIPEILYYFEHIVV